MPMSSGGHVESLSDCATRPKAREIGLTGYVVPIQPSLHIGRYVMVTAEHREPCDSRGSCTVLGAPGGEIPPGDSSIASRRQARDAHGVSGLPPIATNSAAPNEASRRADFVAEVSRERSEAA